MAILLVLAPSGADAAGADCLDTDAALEYWRPVHARAQEAVAPADELALELLPCLGSANAELRDRIAYELFTFWLRGEKLTDQTRRALLAELSKTMAVEPRSGSDSAALARSFSALILAELMRSDSNKPFLSDADRQTVLDNALASLEVENDYRGLDAEIGWVHPVAHMSDLLWRFALHAETSTEQAERILAAVRHKVAPREVFYHFNESDRLARIVTTIVSRKLVAPDHMSSWLASFEGPNTMPKWSDAFASPQGMAELHNTKLFLRALSDQLDGADIDPSISKSLNELVQGFTQLI